MKSKTNPFLTTRDAPAPVDGDIRHLTFEFDRAAVDADARTIALSFSSETPVERWFGSEILDHAPGSVRMGRLNNGGALLMDHNRLDQVGVVESAKIDKDKKGRAVVRFSKSVRAEEIFQDVVDGIRRLVSVGYRIHKTQTETKAGGVETVRVTDWEPFEISIVSIPADDSVGVGRGEPSLHALPNNQNFSNQMNRAQMIAALRAANIAFDESATDEQLRALLPASAQPAVAPAPPVAAPAAQRSVEIPAPAHQPATITHEQQRHSSEDSAQRAIVAERQRTAALQAMATQLQANGVAMDVQRAIADGVTPEAFREQGYNALLARQANYAPGAPGLSAGEQRDLSGFSIVRGIGQLLNGRGLDGLEGEMHQEAIREASRSGVNLEGNFHIPSVVLNSGRRDMTATGGSGGDQGGTMVATSLGSFIDLLYGRLVLRGLGAQVLTGLVGNIDLPKLVTGSTVANLAENATAAESSPTTGKITLSPHRAATYVEVSQQLMMQSSTDVENMVRNDLLTALALVFEARAIYGSGASSQPTGIFATSGIGSIAGGTNGAAPTWDHIVDLETAVAVANADIGTLGYLTNPKVRGKLKKTPIEAGTSAEKIWQKGTEPLNGYRAPVTTQVPSTLTKGSASGVCSAILFGNFSDLILAQWGGISIMANPYIKDIEGLVRLTLNAYHDNIVRRPASFAAMQDALTA